MYTRITEQEAQEVIHESWIDDDYRTTAPLEHQQLQLRHRLGEIDAARVWFEGMHIHYGTFDIQKDFKVKIECDRPVLEMHFCLSGYTHGTLLGEKENFTFDKRQHNMLYTPPLEGIFSIDRQKEPTHMFEVQLTEAYFKRLVTSESRTMNQMVEMMEKQQLFRMVGQNQHLTAQMELVIQEVQQCNKTGLLKRLFLESKVLELLMLQVEQFEQVNTPRPAGIKTQDVERLYEVRRIIEKNIAQPYSLQQLAQMTGLNDFKLKKGFRELFGITVFGYLHDLRMEQARLLLQDHKKTIAEISDDVGYKNPHHFTVAFKKKYGVLPSKI